MQGYRWGTPQLCQYGVLEARQGRVNLVMGQQCSGGVFPTASDVGIAQQSPGVLLHGQQAMTCCSSKQSREAQDGWAEMSIAQCAVGAADQVKSSQLPSQFGGARVYDVPVWNPAVWQPTFHMAGSPCGLLDVS